MLEEQKRLLELYEKGALTKEEARACFLDVAEDEPIFLAEEKASMQFTLPQFKVFASTRYQQEYSFSAIESIRLRLNKGRIQFQKSKEEDVQLLLVYPHEVAADQLPQVYVEGGTLLFDSLLPCQLTLFLPDRWMNVLDMDIGQAHARLDYLPFEDISIHSKTDQKQQEVRLYLTQTASQCLSINLAHASVVMQLPKGQGLYSRLESKAGKLCFNKREVESPFVLEKTGYGRTLLHLTTLTSSIRIKEVKYVWHL